MQKISYSLAILWIFVSLTIVKINSVKDKSNDYFMEAKDEDTSKLSQRIHYPRSEELTAAVSDEEPSDDASTRQQDDEAPQPEATTQLPKQEEPSQDESANAEPAAESTTIAIVVEEPPPQSEDEASVPDQAEQEKTDQLEHEKTTVIAEQPTEPAVVQPTESLTTTESLPHTEKSSESNESIFSTEPPVEKNINEETTKSIGNAKPEDIKLENSSDASYPSNDFIAKNQLYFIVGGVLLLALVIVVVVVLILVKKTNIFSKNTGSSDNQNRTAAQKGKIYKEVPQNEDRI